MEWGRDNLSPSGILTCYGGGGGWVLQVNRICLILGIILRES